MTKETMEQLTKVLVERFKIQEGNDEDKREDGSDYSNEELLAFAVEEAWENYELEFLTELV